MEHYFTPYGYTALFLLAESHFALHTFPEENKTYIELSSCVKKGFYYRFVDDIKDIFKSNGVNLYNELILS